MNEETDLVRRSQGGDLDAFNALVRTYQAHAYNLALRMLGNESMAADAAQEAVISVFRAIGGFRGGDFRSWILRITANSCRDSKLRTANRHM